MRTYPANLRSLPIIPFALEGHQKSLLKVEKTPVAAIRQDFMVMNISCKFEKASYNIFFIRAVTVKSLHTVAVA